MTNLQNPLKKETKQTYNPKEKTRALFFFSAGPAPRESNQRRCQKPWATWAFECFGFAGMVDSSFGILVLLGDLGFCFCFFVLLMGLAFALGLDLGPLV